MPFVATMTMGMAFFMLALFGPREPLTPRAFWLRIGAMLGFFALSAYGQYAIIATDLAVEVPANLPPMAYLAALVTHTVIEAIT